MTTNDLEFIQSALNAYWNDANQQLQKKDLGDIERRNYEYQLSNSKRLMNQIEQADINTVLCGEGINVASTVSIPYGYNNTVTVAKPPSTPTAPLLREGVATDGISSAPEGY